MFELVLSYKLLKFNQPRFEGESKGVELEQSLHGQGTHAEVEGVECLAKVFLYEN